MNIAIIGANNPDSMESHFHDSLTLLGHETKIFDLYNNQINHNIYSYYKAIDKFIRVYNDPYDVRRHLKIFKKIKDFNPDLTICFYRDIHPILIENLRKDNYKVVHVNPDQMTTLGYQQVLASNYNVWFTKDEYMYSFMRNNLHLRVYLYTEAFNHRFNPKPQCLKKEQEEDLGIDVSTYGTLYPYRTRMLKEIVKKGIPIKIYGVKPHRFFDNEMSPHFTGEYIIGKKKAEIIYGSKIVLNNFHFGEVNSVNCRFMEINGSGGFQLSDYRPIMKEILPINPSLVSFKNTDEAVSKIKYYLEHPDDRWSISNCIYNHFLQYYTYDHLVTFILEKSLN